MLAQMVSYQTYNFLFVLMVVFAIWGNMLIVHLALFLGISSNIISSPFQFPSWWDFFTLSPFCSLFWLLYIDVKIHQANKAIINTWESKTKKNKNNSQKLKESEFLKSIFSLFFYKMGNKKKWKHFLCQLSSSWFYLVHPKSELFITAQIRMNAFFWMLGNHTVYIPHFIKERFVWNAITQISSKIVIVKWIAIASLIPWVWLKKKFYKNKNFKIKYIKKGKHRNLQTLWKHNSWENLWSQIRGNGNNIGSRRQDVLWDG